MQVELLEKEDTKMKVKIVGEGHAFANVLRKKLHDDERTESASYNIDHPLLSDPVVRIKTLENESPEEVLMSVSRNLGEEYEEVQMKLEKALEK